LLIAADWDHGAFVAQHHFGAADTMSYPFAPWPLMTVLSRLSLRLENA
jgi:hypothetical protein